MRNPIVWARLLNLTKTIVEGVDLDAQGELVISVRPRRGERHGCGRCGQRSPRYDAGEGRRRWRLLDLGTTLAYLEAPAPRVRCRRHGVVVARVPWADHDARSTGAFDDAVAWLAVHCDKTAVGELMRISSGRRTSRPSSAASWPGSSAPTGRSTRAYLLKEQLRLVFQLPLGEALALLESWPASALRSRIQPFVELAYTVAEDMEPLLAVLEHRLSNARVEALNTRIRLIARRAFGFHSAQALIALAKLSLSGLRPPLPGRGA